MAPQKKSAPAPLPPAEEALLKAFAEWQRISQNRSPATITAYRTTIRGFLTFTRERGLRFDALTRGDITNWQNWIYHQRRNHNPQTIASKLSAIKAFYAFLLHRGDIVKSPAASISSPYIPRHMPKVFTHDQIKRLLALPKPDTPKGQRDRIIMLTLLLTGARNTELRSLSVDSLHKVGDELRVYIFGKGQKERVIAVRPPGAREIMAHAITIGSGPLFLSHSRRDYGAPITATGLNLVLKKYGEAIGIPEPDMFAHRFRATFATSLYDAGHDIAAIATQMGHAVIETTRRYIAISDRALRQTTLTGAWQRSVGVGQY